MSERWVFRMLTIDQKRNRVLNCERLLESYQANKENFLSRYVTMDESWLHHYDPETKAKSSDIMVRHLQADSKLLKQLCCLCSRMLKESS